MATILRIEQAILAAFERCLEACLMRQLTASEGMAARELHT